MGLGGLERGVSGGEMDWGLEGWEGVVRGGKGGGKGGQ